MTKIKTMTINDNKTGWVKYHITGSSGCGFGEPHYLYLPFDEEYIKMQILEVYESWTQHADSFTLIIDIGVVPPLEIIETEIKNVTTEIEYHLKVKNKLIKMKDDFDNLSLIRN